MNKQIKYTATKGRIKILKVMAYRGAMVYIRQIDDTIFEYILTFENQIYSSFIEMDYAKGKKKFTKNEINGSAAIIFSGATATIDELLNLKVEEIKAASINEGFKKPRQGALTN